MDRSRPDPYPLRDARARQVAHSVASSMLGRTFDDWQEPTATGLGLATHANLRNTATEAGLEAPKRRVEALQGPLRPTGH